MLFAGERGDTETPQTIKSAKSLLQHRKSVLDDQRKHRREQIKSAQGSKTRSAFMPQFSDLDIKKYVRESEMKITIRSAEYRRESYNVPDHSTTKKRGGSSKVANKFKLIGRFKKLSSATERLGDQVLGVTDSQPCRAHCFTRDHGWRMMSDHAKKRYLMNKFTIATGKGEIKEPKKKEKVEVEQRKLTIPLIYITTCTGSTYIHPISLVMLRAQRKKQNEELEKLNREKSPVKKRTLVLRSDVSKDNQRKANIQPSPVAKHKDKVKEGGQSGGKFPKAKLVLHEESSSEDSDNESDGLEDNPFNTKKINIKYSVEKIRRAKAERKRQENPQKDDVFQMLAKYCRVQNVLKAFSRGRRNPNPSGRRWSMFPPSTATKKPKLRSLSLGNKLPVEKMQIGKLKWFSFLDKKQETNKSQPLPINETKFDTFPMNQFRVNVHRALDEFVVRKEVVISDTSAKASVSITFTKKSVFTQQKRSGFM